jgi:hypothetical protein
MMFLDKKVLDSTHGREPQVFVLSSCFLGKDFEIASSQQHKYLFHLVVVQRF